MKITGYYNRDTLLVDCPTCDAEKGQRCVTAKGKPARKNHVNRWYMLSNFEYHTAWLDLQAKRADFVSQLFPPKPNRKEAPNEPQNPNAVYHRKSRAARKQVPLPLPQD